MRCIFFVLMVVLCGHSSYAQKKTLADKRFAGLDTLIPAILRDWHGAGCAVAIVHKNDIVYIKGFGYRNYHEKQPVTENTQFAIGSSTKAFTTTLLGQLVQEGKLDLDKPVTGYLPELSFYNDEMNRQITTRDMMSHRTGLPRHDYAWYGSETTHDSLLYRIRFLEPSAGLREKWQYNNFMYLAQGMLAAKLGGKSWEALVKEKIFQPLGMNTATFSISELQKQPDYSLGYDEENDTIKIRDFMNIDAIGPAGSINANIKEMANWIKAWVNDGKFEGRQVIPASFRSQAITSQMAMGSGTPGKENPDVFFSDYGLGWMLQSYRGHYLVEHGGNIDGFSANVAFYPSDSIGIVVLTNQNGSPLITLIRNTLSDRMLGLEQKKWSQQLKIQRAKARMAPAAAITNVDSLNRKTGTKPSHPLADYTGVYENKGYGKIVIDLVADTLQFHYHKIYEDFFLDHYHYDFFVLKSKEDPTESGLKIKFNTGVQGNIEMLDAQIEPSVKPVEFVKLQAEKKLSGGDLQKYVGEYLLGNVAVKVYIRSENTLMVLVPGQPDYELLPAGKDEFNLKVAKGYSVKFDTGADEKITALNFIQPNGVFKAVKKQ